MHDLLIFLAFAAILLASPLAALNVTRDGENSLTAGRFLRHTCKLDRLEKYIHKHVAVQLSRVGIPQRRVIAAQQDQPVR